MLKISYLSGDDKIFVKPYSNEIRNRVVTAYENKKGSYRCLAERFMVSLSFVQDIMKLYRQTGSVSPRPHGGGVLPKISSQGLAAVGELSAGTPDASLKELCQRFFEKTGVSVSQSVMCNALKKLGLTVKKKTFRAAEQDRDDVKKARESFQKEMPLLPAQSLVFIDESGAALNMARSHARSPKGERAYSKKPFSRGKRFTMIDAVGLNGVTASLTVEGSVNGEIFLTFVRDVLSPSLRPGHTVFADNLSSHKVKGVKEAAEAAGAVFRYLPPYSPEFSPIELYWSKIKSLLKKAAPRNAAELHEAVRQAGESVREKDFAGWFESCGYCMPSG